MRKPYNTPHRTHVVKTRLTDEEHELFLNQCRTYGISQSEMLLIIDDFGMERGTEYGLEQVYNVIDSRYRSGKPLIVTTNLTLDSLQNPQDTAHARIYGRLLEMCAPILFTGENFRKQTATEKLDRLKGMLEEQKKGITVAAADIAGKGETAYD